MLVLLYKETKSTTIKHAIHSKINNERVYIDYSFRVSSKRFFAGFPKFENKKTKKKTENR